MANVRERQMKILAFMKEAIKTKGYPPTIREICEAMHVKSTSTVHKDIESLVKEGYLKKDPSKPRALMVVDSPMDASHASNLDVANQNTIEIPVVGRVAAGLPILAEQNIDDSFPVPARFVNGGTNFMLTVKGESMVEAGIFDGDYILVEQTNEAHNGEIVVALVDGFETEATVKTFYKEDDHIRLQPENKTMSPIIVENARIVGKVKGVFRYFN
ncbi:MAG: transcriptional repressor LexA [Clostridia bacterium]|nr:transcriptional repressor LexA [Clostridia bacterium]